MGELWYSANPVLLRGEGGEGDQEMSMRPSMALTERGTGALRH